MSAPTQKRGRGRPPKAETVIAREVKRALDAATEKTPQGKNQRAFKAKYDAGGMGKRMAGWVPPSSGPNAALTGLQSIRNRARDSRRNDWAATGATQKWTTNLIGVGITPRFERFTDQARKQAVTDLYSDFVAKADADWVLDLYGLQRLAVDTWLDGGECFIRRRPRFLDDDELAVPLQVQLIEPDYCPLLTTKSFDGLPANNEIRLGVEFDKRGKRIAYWFFKEHPGDDASKIGMPSADSLVRVAASDVIHLFEPTRAGQIRGVPHLAAVLMRLRNSADYDDATLERMKLSNLFAGFIETTVPSADPESGDYNTITGEEEVYDEGGAPLIGLAPGLMQSLAPGEKMSWSNPPEAGVTFPDYMRVQNLGVAAGVGLPAELLTGDLREISDRTLRVMINEFRRHAEQRQWQIIIPQMCQRIIEWFGQAAVLAGKISVEEYELVRRPKHSPHGWAHIHPVQDPQGKKLEVEAGFRSRASVIAERGDDPVEVDEERQADDEREQDLEIGSYSAAMVAANAPAGATGAEDGDTDGIDDNEYSAPPNAALLALVDKVIAQNKTLAAEVAALKKASAAPKADATEQALFARMLDMLGPGDAVQ